MLPVASMNLTMDQLRGLIGLKVIYQNQPWEIIEILEDGPALVLQDSQMHQVIQPDQFGEAHRRVPPTVTIPVFTLDKTELHPSFLSLDPEE